MSEGLDPILQQKEQQQLKTQLLWRLGIAGGLIAALLFGIAWIEKSQKNAEPKVQIPQIAPELNASEPVAAASAASEAIASIAAPIASATPTSSNTPNPTATATIVATATPSITASPAAKQSNSSTIQKIGNVPKTIPTNSNKPEATIKEAATAIPLNKSASTTNAPAKVALKPPSISTTTASPEFPAPINNARGYSVQAGVFLLSNNAEKLLGQLHQAGIPAYLETRVQIGPFKSKAEADAAVKKLKALGITPVVKTQ